MTTDVTLACRTEQGVDDGVCHDIGVAVAEQAGLSLELHPAQHEAPTLSKAVDVESYAHAHASVPVYGFSVPARPPLGRQPRL